MFKHALSPEDDFSQKRTVSRQTQYSAQQCRHSEEEHSERKAFLVYLACLLAILLADLLYNEPL